MIYRSMTWFVVLISVPVHLGLASAEASDAPRLGLTVEWGRFVKDGKPYRGIGVNSFDLFIRVLQRPEDTTSFEGIETLSKNGIPFVRFAACGFKTTEWKLYMGDKEEYFRRMDLVVRAAEKANVGLIPSLFWAMSLHELVGETRDQWGNPTSKTSALMRQYVGDVVGRYKDSPAIWAWEFGNEISLKVDLPRTAKQRDADAGEKNDVKSEHLVTMLREFAKEVRRHDTYRAMFSGNSQPRAQAWHNTNEHNWKYDSAEQFRRVLMRDNPAELKTIGVHVYGSHDVVKDVGIWAKDRGDYLHRMKEYSRMAGRPVFVGEFGLCGDSSAKNDFEIFIDDLERAKIDLAAVWVYDRTQKKDAWNVTFENDRAYMLRIIAEANRRWNQAAFKSCNQRRSIGHRWRVAVDPSDDRALADRGQLRLAAVLP